MAAPININANLNVNSSSINASAKQVQQALGRITGQASEFQKSLDASTARVFAFGATTAVINGVTQSFKALISTTITVQSKLIEINSILGAGTAEFNKYRNAIFDVAKTTGQSFQTVADGAAELARQGLGATESAKRLEAALILTRISGLGSAQSVKALTAAMNGFTSAGLSAEKVVNKIVAVDTAFAVSAQDLADGFSRAGSTAEDAGVSFDELLGLITAVEQRTARGGAVIGNAFKSIFTRLSRGSTIEDLKALGVQIDATQTGVQKLQALSKALENISDPTKASAIKELAGGVFQINVVSAALKDIGDEASVFGEATKKSFNASNEATEKNIALNDQLTAQINSLVVSITSLGEKIGSLTFGPLLKNLVSVATVLSEALDGALDPEKGNAFIQGLFKVIGGFIAGPGLIIFTVAFAKIFKTVIKFAKEGFKSVMQIGSASEKIKQVESGIVNLLQKDAKLRDVLVSTTTTQAQKEKAVISAIKRENALLTQQETLVRSIASMTINKGVSGYSTSGGFRGGKRRRFSEGGGGIMEPDLETAMINEARDAPRGASPFVTKFRGQTAVMNTSETKVRIGGREEILTEEQTDELIPRYNKGSRKKRGAPIKTKDYAFLVPKVGVRKTLGPMEYQDRKFDGKSPIRGPRKNAIKGVSDNTEANLEGSLTKNIINGALKWTEKLSPLGRKVKYSSIRRGFDTTDGAKGGLKAAIGGAFEVAISRSLDYESAKREKGGDFDIRGGRNLHRIQDLFGIYQRIADFKVSDSDGNKRNFLSKVAKEKGYYGKGKRDASVANVSQQELNKKAAQQARLNVKNRFGNDKKFQQGTTIPLKKYKEEMEKEIAKETERLKRDVYYNASSNIDNKKDRDIRKKRDTYEPPRRRRIRIGRRAKGSLSASKFNSLKRYRFGSLGKDFLKQIGISAAFSSPELISGAMSEDGLDAGNVTRGIGTSALSFLAYDKLFNGNKGTPDGTPDGAPKPRGKIGRAFDGGKDILSKGVGRGTSKVKRSLNIAKAGITPAFRRKSPVPQGSYHDPKSRKALENAGKRNKVIDNARRNVTKGALKGGAGFVGGMAIDAVRDPIRSSLQTEGGQDTNASVFTDMMLGGASTASAMPGGPLGKAAGFIYGTGKAGIDMYGDAVNKQVEEEERGQKIEGRTSQIRNRANLDSQYGIGATMNEDGSLTSKSDRVREKTESAFGGNILKAKAFAANLRKLGKELVQTDHTSLAGAVALRKYEATLQELNLRINDGSGYEQAKRSIEGFREALLGLAKTGSLAGQLESNRGKLKELNDKRDFIGVMSGPNKEKALRDNKVESIYRQTLDKKLTKENLESQQAAIQGITDPELRQQAITGAGIDQEGKSITDYFKGKIKEAADDFESSVRSGAKTMIMERIVIAERIKDLQSQKRQFTGGKDPETGEMIQGSINQTRVSEIMQGANTPAIDAGRVRSIVEAMGDARDSGDQEKFQNAMANLNEELQGRLTGNEDKVLGQFGFDLDDPKNKAFFDKVGKDSVVNPNSGSQEDRDFIYGLDGSGKDEKAAAGLDKEIESNKKQLDDLNLKIAEFGEVFDKKDIVDSMVLLADSARKAAEGIADVADAGTGATDIAEEARGILESAKSIIEVDAERIKRLNSDFLQAKQRMDDFESELKTIKGDQT